MELAILNKSGQDTGRKAVLNDSIFAIEPNDHAIYLDVKQYLANQRQGTHKSKQKAEVSGSTRKLKKQKGTGGARAGSIKSGVFRGGGRIFGPQPRDYAFKLNKKLKRLARKSALSYKAQQNKLVVVEPLVLAAPKTKEIVALKNNLKIADKRLLILLPDQNKNVYLSSRNLQGIDVLTASDVSTYDVMRAGSILLVEGSVEVLEQVLKA
jgi:large subunit ribosomal protein L4